MSILGPKGQSDRLPSHVVGRLVAGPLSVSRPTANACMSCSSRGVLATRRLVDHRSRRSLQEKKMVRRGRPDSKIHNFRPAQTM